jgi:hypothetical protein
VVLLSISVLSSIAVGVGIILERPKYSPAVHKVAFWLVVVGIGFEAVCTIFLFVFDEGISNAQQDKIITLETKLEQTGDFALRQAMDRWLSFDWGACTKLIDEKRATNVEVVWVKSSSDARMLADTITHCLMGVDGWSQTKPSSVAPIDSMPDEANSSGVTVMGKTGGLWQLNNTAAPADFIMKALAAGMEKVPGGIRFSPDRSLPPDLVRIVVGPK